MCLGSQRVSPVSFVDVCVWGHNDYTLLAFFVDVCVWGHNYYTLLAFFVDVCVWGHNNYTLLAFCVDVCDEYPLMAGVTTSIPY